MNNSPLADEAARSRIAGDLHRTLFVDAGAGTGKTSVLVRRIVGLVADGTPIERIAAITFTEAAAGELADRVRTAFEHVAVEDAGTERGRRAAAALEDLDLAAITTLHGFARRILSDHAAETGLPPRVEVIDEVASVLEEEERWAHFVDRLHDLDPSTGIEEEVLVRAALVDVPLEPRYPNHATMRDVAAELAQGWDLLDTVLAEEHPPLGPIDFTSFDSAVGAFEARCSSCTDPDDLFLVHATQQLLPRMRQVRDHPDPLRKLELLHQSTARSTPAWTRGRGGRRAAWDGDVTGAKDHVDAVVGCGAAVVAQVADEVLRRLLRGVAGEVREAADARRRDGRLAFHDLLVLARALVRERPEVRQRLHQRLDCLLLDEFQDTDPIQIELAVRIAAAVGADDPGAGWSDLDVEEGRLFFVGDPKQSIYRFRRADIELYLAARQRFAGGGISLTTNFRTVPAVLDWVNAFYSRDDVMGRGAGAAQPAYEALAAHRSGSPGHDHRPVLLGGPMDGARAAELREAEAADVAAVVADVRDAPRHWPVADPSTGAWRPASLADVTILVPTRTSLPYLRAALDEAEIPFRLDAGTLVYDTQEVRDLLAALRAVDDPTDELAVVTALRSALYACSDPDLARFRRAGGRFDLVSPLPDTLDVPAPVADAITHLRSLRDQRWTMSTSALLDRLVTDRGAFALALADPRPADVWRRLRFLVDQAHLHEYQVGGGLRAFLEWAELQRAERARVHEPVLPETDVDAVRIMTIHAAKGLEFPITIVSGTTTRPAGNRRGVSVLWSDDRPVVEVNARAKMADHDARADLEATMDAHERIRLLYVATTRARDHLVVTTHHRPDVPDSQRTYAHLVWDAMAHDPRSRLLEPGDPPTPPRLVPAPVTVADDRDAWLTARHALLAPHRVPRTMAASALAIHDGGGAGLDPALAEGSVRGPAGTAFGSAVHACLQHVDLHAMEHPDGRDRIDQLARWAIDRTGPAGAEAAVADTVRSVLASPSVTEARAHPHHRELFVAAPVGDVVVEGYVDLVIESPDGLVVVDYKTDLVDDDALERVAAGYAPQAAAYALALEAVTGNPVREVRLVFCRPEGVREVVLDGLRQTMDAVRDTLTPAQVP